MDCIDHGKRGDKGGYTNQDRYGKTYRMHRLVYTDAYSLHIKDIDGLVVMHTCDNPRCINPHHLRIGTQADNMRTMCLRGRKFLTVGDTNGQSKLSYNIAEYVRNNYIPRHREYGARAMARKFGVTIAPIIDILHNRSWIVHGHTNLKGT